MGDQEKQELDSGGLKVIGSYGSARAAHDAGLSILAAGESYWVRVSEGRFELAVDEDKAEALLGEVRAAEARNRFWPPRSLLPAVRTVSKLPTALAVCVVVAAYAMQSHLPELERLGVNSCEGTLLRGEWWRVVTAMSLHADVGHLAGNLLGLSLFAHFCCRYLGNGMGWFLILLAGGLSNATSVLVRGADAAYVSLGASTAVFGALGLLAGVPLAGFARKRRPVESRHWLMPFFGGCVLFAWMGGGAFPTDVGAHVWAFAYGSLLGGLAALVGWADRRASRALGLVAGLACGVLLAGAWAWAWAAG